MELRQLKYFLKAAETLNFTEAAKEIFISQSTLSHQIKQLEIELGSPLFNRIGKKVVLTQTGHTFRSYASQCVYNAHQGYQAIRELNNIEKGEINIGVTYALSSMITNAIIKFKLSYPNVKLNILFGTTNELLQQLKDLKADLICSFLDTSIHDPALNTELLLKSTLKMIVSKKSSLASKKSITLQELSETPMALPDKGYSPRQFLDRIMSENRLLTNLDIEINDIPTLFRLVETGKWVTVLTEITIQEQTDLIAIEIQGTDMTQQAYIIKLTDIIQPNSINEFCKLLK